MGKFLFPHTHAGEEVRKIGVKISSISQRFQTGSPARHRLKEISARLPLWLLGLSRAWASFASRSLASARESLRLGADKAFQSRRIEKVWLQSFGVCFPSNLRIPSRGLEPLRAREHTASDSPSVISLPERLS